MSYPQLTAIPQTYFIHTLLEIFARFMSPIPFQLVFLLFFMVDYSYMIVQDWLVHVPFHGQFHEVWLCYYINFYYIHQFDPLNSFMLDLYSIILFTVQQRGLFPISQMVLRMWPPYHTYDVMLDAHVRTLPAFN